jgi:hypothetical protein
MTKYRRRNVRTNVADSKVACEILCASLPNPRDSNAYGPNESPRIVTKYSNKIVKSSAYNMVTIISVLIRRDAVVYNLCIFNAFDQGFWKTY